MSANVAGRDLAVGLTSAALPVDSQGDFSLATTTVTFIDGAVAYRASTNQSGGDSVIGEDGTLSGTASLSTSSSGGDLVETLTIPINASIPFAVDANTSINLVLTGQLVATALLPSTIPGDFNEDGTVDAADYVVWRKGVGVESTPANYNLWRTNFGRTSGAAGQSSAVPEPASLTMLIAVLSMLIGVRRSP